MRWAGIALLALLPACDSGQSAEVRELRGRVEQLEADRVQQEEVNQLLLSAMNAMAVKLDGFLRMLQGGEGVALPEVPVGTDPAATDPAVTEPAGTEPGEADPQVTPPVEANEPVTDPVAADPEPLVLWGLAIELWLAIGAAVLALGALLWNRRSPVPVPVAVAVPVVPESVDLSEVVPEGVSEVVPEPDEERVEELIREPVGDLSVEDVGRELALANVAPVELDEPLFGEAVTRVDGPPCSVQWRLSCADPGEGSRLARELLVADPRVLAAPEPRIEPEAQSLRVGYHVHPGLTLADRTQIAARLIEVLRAVRPGVRRGAAPRS